MAVAQARNRNVVYVFGFGDVIRDADRLTIFAFSHGGLAISFCIGTNEGGSQYFDGAERFFLQLNCMTSGFTAGADLTHYAVDRGAFENEGGYSARAHRGFQRLVFAFVSTRA